MRSSSEWPSDAAVSFLSDALEPAPPSRFCLSPKACEGIIRRAEKRGKSLPPQLNEALRAQASSSTKGAGAGNIGWESEQSPTCTADWHNPAVCIAVAVDPVICMADDNAKAAIDEGMCGSLKVGGSAPWIAQGRMVVRRLTPMECERLQGFTDNWTKVPYRGKPAEECPDGPRYKAIGNSFAVPVVRWIGERIAIADNEEE